MGLRVIQGKVEMAALVAEAALVDGLATTAPVEMAEHTAAEEAEVHIGHLDRVAEMAEHTAAVAVLAMEPVALVEPTVETVAQELQTEATALPFPKV